MRTVRVVIYGLSVARQRNRGKKEKAARKGQERIIEDMDKDRKQIEVKHYLAVHVRWVHNIL